jgi:tetratricopeptide (TPR) repeat protein
MAVGSLKILVRERAVAGPDGVRWALTPRFFYLYLFLAWQRRAPGPERDRYVTCEEIRRLPFWEKNRVESVGKQVWRHVAAMTRRGRNVIEGLKASTGPYRLGLAPRAITFDAPAAEVRQVLDVPELKPGVGPTSQIFRLVEATYEGREAFDKGMLDAARAAYGRALAAAETPEQKAMAMQHLGRVLERQGSYAEARRVFARALGTHHRRPMPEQTTRARTHLFLGWLEYRQARHGRARAHYQRAFDIARGVRDDWLLGNLHNAMGLLEKRGDALTEALARFRTALDYWCRADYAYGIAAAYANIGSTHLREAERLAAARLGAAAQARYRNAAEWFERCVEFSARARLGNDTSDAETGLAQAYLALGQGTRAWDMANLARERAEGAGNALDLAEALFVLGRLAASRGDGEAARNLFREAAARFERIGHPARAGAIRRDWLDPSR